MGVTLPFRLLEPLGAEIEYDLSQPLAPSEAYHFRQLFAQRGLLLARGQDLTMERQRELCALLGPILEREGETGTMSNETGGPAASALSWHSDAAYTEHPFLALSLHALDVVDDASSTRFMNAEAALETLPDDLCDALAGRKQEMIAPHYTRIVGRTCDDPDPQAQKRGERPTLVENPQTGRTAIWVNEMQTVRILDMEREESRSLLHAAFCHLYAPDRVFEHRWRKGDVIFWDNIALQHARGNVEEVGPRLLQRVIVGTEGVAPHIVQ